MLAETLERLMRSLDAIYRDILALQLQGATTPEISAHVGYAQRTVRRTLASIRNRLREPPEE